MSNPGEGVEKVEPLYTVGVNVKCSLCGKQLVILQKVKHRIAIAIPLLDICPTELKTGTPQ